MEKVFPLVLMVQKLFTLKFEFVVYPHAIWDVGDIFSVEQ